MMIVILVGIVSVTIIGLFILVCHRTDWKTIDEQNQRFYVDGYHLYYDRKIIKRNEVERLKSKLK